MTSAGRAWVTAAAIPLTVALAAGAEAAPNGAITIRHDPLSCVTLDRYARVSASADPAERVASAELQFREEAGRGWYGVRMTADGDAWAALLPKPVRPVRRIEYRVVMTDRDLRVHEAPVVGVTVAQGAECGAGAASALAVSAPIVVRVPAGAPLMPPVPAGFSPAGVVAATQPERKSRKAAVMGGGAVLAAGIAAATVAGAEPQLAETNNPKFTFFGATPTAGSQLTPRSFLTVLVLVTGQSLAEVTFNWRLELRSPDNACQLSMQGDVVSAVSTVPVRLNSQPILAGACGTTVDLPTARFVITIGGAIVHDEILELRYTYVR